MKQNSELLKKAFLDTIPVMTGTGGRGGIGDLSGNFRCGQFPDSNHDCNYAAADRPAEEH